MVLLLSSRDLDPRPSSKNYLLGMSVVNQMRMLIIFFISKFKKFLGAGERSRLGRERKAGKQRKKVMI